MDITKFDEKIIKLIRSRESLLVNLELITKRIHEFWLIERAKKGFHPPTQCPNMDVSESQKSLESGMFCDKCDINMYPYTYISEEVKNRRRESIISFIEELNKFEGLIDDK